MLNYFNIMYKKRLGKTDGDEGDDGGEEGGTGGKSGGGGRRKSNLVCFWGVVFMSSYILLHDVLIPPCEQIGFKIS